MSVVGKLLERNVVVGVFVANDDVEFFGGVPLELGERVDRVRPVVLVEVGQGCVLMGDGIGRNLIAIAGCPLVPEAGAEDAEPGTLANR